MKAGLMEIAHLFVINKADREGADKTALELRQMLEMTDKGSRDRAWVPPIVKTEAVTDQGVGEALEAIQNHYRFLTEEGAGHMEAHLYKKMKIELMDLVRQRVIEAFLMDVEESGELDAMVGELVQRRLDPYTACDRIVSKRLKQ